MAAHTAADDAFKLAATLTDRVDHTTGLLFPIRRNPPEEASLVVVTAFRLAMLVVPHGQLITGEWFEVFLSKLFFRESQVEVLV